MLQVIEGQRKCESSAIKAKGWEIMKSMREENEALRERNHKLDKILAALDNMGKKTDKLSEENEILLAKNKDLVAENDLLLADYDKMQVICQEFMIELHQKEQELEILRQQVRDLKSLNAEHTSFVQDFIAARAGGGEVLQHLQGKS